MLLKASHLEYQWRTYVTVASHILPHARRSEGQFVLSVTQVSLKFDSSTCSSLSKKWNRMDC